METLIRSIIKLDKKMLLFKDINFKFHLYMT